MVPRSDETHGVTASLLASPHLVRPEVPRSTDHHDPLIRRALGVVRQPLHPVRVIGTAEVQRLYAVAALVPPDGLEAFRAPGDASDPHIYVHAEGAVYVNASRKPTALAILKLAAVLLHEQVHNTDRELAAYRLQADFVLDRLHELPRREQAAARQYLAHLEAKARALARAHRPTG